MIDRAVVSLIKNAKKTADEILRANAAKLHELASYLLERETITGAEFMQILKK